MVSIVTKNINGKDYLYLVESIREENKVVQKTIKYIGPKRPILNEEFECMKLSHENKDWILTDFKEELSYVEHKKMKDASDAYKKHLESLDEFSKEKEKQRFLSNFIANSNSIEGSTLSVKDTHNFLFEEVVPKGHSKKEIFMAINLLDAWNYLENHFSALPTKEDLFEMHKRVNKNIESEETLGSYKKVQNYIGDVYTASYLFVEEKIEKLLVWMKSAFRNVDDFEVAFQSHAQFEIIHPFVDGNGRVGRFLINWLLLNKGLMPLAINNKRRSEYISALDHSRKGKVEAIVKFCFKEYLENYKFVETD
ncbi:MAG: Fic family protein [Nanoarchaeota archaeon]